MPQIDFLISNNSHHAAMFLPVVEALAARPSYRCRIISLCEFRGLRSPVERFQIDGVTFEKVLPFKLRPSPSVGRQMGNADSQGARQLARKMSWHLLLGPRVRAGLKAAPDLAVLPNDAAFPYNHICDLLRVRQIPFLLVQEGIRFPLPGIANEEPYGSGGAAAIAAWGETSAEYFRHVGVRDERIHLTGNPRFDVILGTDWYSEAERIKAQWKIGTNALLFLSNPIDDQGFCTTQEKLELIRRFIVGLMPLFNDPAFHLILKLHGRESVKDVQALVAGLRLADRVTVLGVGPPYPLFVLSRAAVVMTSTAGLEALLFGLPLGVLEIPRVGFVFDYVSSGVAMGLTWDAPLADQVKALLEFRQRRQQVVEAYVVRNLATRNGATDRIVKLIMGLVERK